MVKRGRVCVMKDTVVKELNTFLEGNYMAIQTYDKYINHVEDARLKKILQEIQQDHKKHAMVIAERIQNLGGMPAKDAGLKGNMAQMMKNLQGTTKDDPSIIKDALVGEERGIKMSQELLEGDLDPESLRIVEEVLARDEEHVKMLRELLQ